MKTLSFAVLVAAGLVWGCGPEQIVTPEGSAIETAPSPWDPTVTLSVSPASLVSGDTATLVWISTNATRCTASGGWSGSKATSGSQSTGPLTATTSFTLTCSRWRWYYGWIRSAQTVSVTVTSASVPTLSLSADPSNVARGGAATLTWTSTNATTCTASDGWSGDQATSGTFSTGPLTSTTTFTLTCNGAGGSATQSTTVSVTGAAPTVVLNANPTNIPNGGSSSLEWSSTAATTCTASGGWSGTKATSGTQSTGALTATTTFALSCAGPGGTGSASATVLVEPPTGPPPTHAAFPLRVEAGKRYLVDAQGRAFLIHGDSPWLLIAGLTKPEIDQYLEDRRQRGFNTVLVELIEHEYSLNGRNVLGDLPFTSLDFTRPNEAYFAHAEYAISKALEKGILVLLSPAYVGYQGNGSGWYAEMVANGPTKMRTYGQYVATRFRAYDNIVWVHGGDWDLPSTNLVEAVANGIRDVDTKWLHTFHGARGTSALGFVGLSAPWVTVNNIYTHADDVVAKAFTEYNRASMPFFDIEGMYENENGATAHTVRQQAYQSVLSGAAGHVMGNNPIWQFGGGWQSALNSGAARTFGYLRTLFEARAWWTLVPDQTQTLRTTGVGSGAAMSAAALASDRSFGLVYTPSVRDLTISLARLAGPRVTARWYDPTNGTYTAITGSPFAATGTRVFRPAGLNSGSAGDWVLVLESSP